MDIRRILTKAGMSSEQIDEILAKAADHDEPSYDGPDADELTDFLDDLAKGVEERRAPAAGSHEEPAFVEPDDEIEVTELLEGLAKSHEGVLRAFESESTEILKGLGAIGEHVADLARAHRELVQENASLREEISSLSKGLEDVREGLGMPLPTRAVTGSVSVQPAPGDDGAFGQITAEQLIAKATEIVRDPKSTELAKAEAVMATSQVEAGLSPSEVNARFKLVG